MSIDLQNSSNKTRFSEKLFHKNKLIQIRKYLILNKKICFKRKFYFNHLYQSKKLNKISLNLSETTASNGV